MKTLLLLLSLLSVAAEAQSIPLQRTPPPTGGCNGASAVCLAQSYTATSKFVVQGTTAPQFESTGTSPLEFRAYGAANSDGVFRFHAQNSITSNYILKVSEKAGTSAEPRMTLDHQGTLRLYPEDVGLAGGGLEMFGRLSQTNGGADGPFIIGGGVNTTAFTGRLLSIQRPVGAVQVWNIRADGSAQWTGVATGSLGVCNASAEGTLQWDTTTKTWKTCNATTWKEGAFNP